MPTHLTKTQEKQVKTEARERLRDKLKRKARNSADSFKKELKKHTATAITAAFAFLIALSWRTPIKNSVDKLVTNLGLVEKALLFEYISAITITIIAVVALMIIAKWTSTTAK